VNAVRVPTPPIEPGSGCHLLSAVVRHGKVATVAIDGRNVNCSTGGSK